MLTKKVQMLLKQVIAGALAKVVLRFEMQLNEIDSNPHTDDEYKAMARLGELKRKEGMEHVFLCIADMLSEYIDKDFGEEIRSLCLLSPLRGK